MFVCENLDACKYSDAIRVDICAEQLNRHATKIAIQGEANHTLSALLEHLPPAGNSMEGPDRAKRTRLAALEEIGPDYRAQVEVLNALRDAVPGSIMVGDSTQPIYAGNLYYDHDRAGGWFNAATGYGALGYGIPAAIGASVADPKARVICITGDGGAQFSLPEIMAAVDENLPITFVIWNNHGCREIATSMQDAGLVVVGCDPSPPDFQASARSFGIPYWHCGTTPRAAAEVMASAARHPGPSMIEIEAPKFVSAKV